MKIEQRVILSEEELATISKAFEILEDYRFNLERVNDPNNEIKETASDACNRIDDFLCAYDEVYE